VEIDQSDPDCPMMSLEMQETPEDVMFEAKIDERRFSA
jgi:hypothetical protein